MKIESLKNKFSYAMVELANANNNLVKDYEKKIRKLEKEIYELKIQVRGEME